ncbi:hypothetical protein IVB25_14280 [Bradyrhizobium sp. 193]|nr:hypothetical protein [Bradyrhizobium sp. 193]MCK1500266.1 hypothetical protein [Bradyrhizobium sp. 188]MCK1568362.1 hypothetical protein [Bradyrhizobium sp. 173]UPJ84830.1 hypothetical protein IVB17_39550 [Bradyrhizobium sp. 184]UPJ92669.1 hypothetical protein IVB16_39845 [Bradyrhizobium sp. 183]
MRRARANELRRSLKSRRRSKRLLQVRLAALANGFWHLGEFPRVYRRAFRELPSQTRAWAKQCRQLDLSTQLPHRKQTDTGLAVVSRPFRDSVVDPFLRMPVCPL